MLAVNVSDIRLAEKNLESLRPDMLAPAATKVFCCFTDAL